MSIYYKCLRGDNEHLALFEAEAFAVTDTTGRTWICFPIDAQEVENRTLAGHMTDVLTADAQLRAQGFSKRGTEVQIIYCEEGPHELQAKLK